MEPEKVQCQFFVLKKKRLCRMTVKIGETFCGEHIAHTKPTETLDGSSVSLDEKRVRVPCPFDSTHTCFKSQLAKHMARCNSKPSESKPDYICPGINAGPAEEEVPKVRLNDVSDDELLSLINRVNTIYNEKIKEHPSLAEEIKRPDIGAPALKHLLQNSTLISLMEDENLLKDNSCFVEMGAGKGKLTFWIAQATKTLQNCKYSLVDISTCRHKSENKLPLEGVSAEVIRVRANVADLLLEKVEFHEGCQFVVPVSKHLCGAATDFALRCVGNSISSGMSIQTEGLVMALCCHHRCEWRHYVGKEFFKSVELSPRDFSRMCVLVSWATCGTGKSRLSEEKSADQQDPNPHRDRYDRLKLCREVREEIGRKCKLVIDQGRVDYLQSLGFNSELVYYVKQSITLENVCLIGKKSVKS
ncbi:tRNA:m(4)X modification enzyme TRM13 homolog isoform X2 [Neocloeon triangulifer]|uniref:tRNA:m(4)X modification enzyme TRM13 homolog isoform X2 n=1 Tax=Neocloeon triangulifer TaxID=2078957 RepID=UPI00286EF9A4|nr:tRNA:m(4)X modification enzyme TRM13 homolog isoform X2 [Neocloeon triangulifer]